MNKQTNQKHNNNAFFIRGRELQRRLAERVKEAELDNRDRLKEKEELDELKTEIFSSEVDDPNAEFERVSPFIIYLRKYFLAIKKFKIGQWPVALH